MALNRSPEFCLKLTYRYLLKADHVPGDTWSRAIFGHSGIILTNLVEVYKVMLHIKYQGLMVSGEDFLMFFPI